MNSVIAYITKEIHIFIAWLEALVHIHKTTGSLPPAPKPGETVGVTSPAPPPVTTRTNTYAQVGDTLAPGVKFRDGVNGLVSFDKADAIFPGQLFCTSLLAPFIAIGSQARATCEYNGAYGKMGDIPGDVFPFHVRVNTMVPAETIDGTKTWKNSNPWVWVDGDNPHCWTIGDEFDSWVKAEAEAVQIATNMAKSAAAKK